MIREAKLDSGRSWTRVSAISETSLEHSHLMKDDADTETVNEAASGRASDDVSFALLPLLF